MMNDYERLVEETKKVLDKLYNTKEKEEYEKILATDLKAVNDKVAEGYSGVYPNYRKWVSERVAKQKEYKEKYWSRASGGAKYTPKSSYIFREETDKAIGNLCNVVADYIKSLIQ